MKHIKVTGILIFFFSTVVLNGQSPDFTGYRIFINPGHGGHDSDDRHMLTADFWESEGNLEKGLFLRTLLTNMHAEVYMSRTTNETVDDLPLSQIATMANNVNADFFLSIHSNGFDGKQNQPLMLFRGYDDQPVFPAAKTMAQIMWQKIFEKGIYWTSSSVWVKGDWTFYPDWGDKVGLGVLRTLNMPGVLSEGSFHDYIPESWRLRNNQHLHHEAWAFVRSFTEFVNVTPLTHGIIAGVVRDSLKSPSWYYKAGTRDQYLALNGAMVTLSPGDITYQVDNLNNGFFFFDSIPPGEYDLYFEGVENYFKDTMKVTVTANKSTVRDICLIYDTTLVPQMTGISPSLSDSILFNQELTLTFDLPMNRDSVEKALELVPETEMVYTWDDKNMVLKIKPAVSYAVKTNYILRLTTVACSKWKVPIAEQLEYAFVTKNRLKLKIERSFPTEGKTGVTLYPQVRIYFDAPLDQATATAAIQLLNDQGQPLTKLREGCAAADGKGIYYFEVNQPLVINKQYKVTISTDLKDVTGLGIGQAVEMSFTTRTTNYPTGTVVETYDDITKFWDPEASGSTVGTDNPLTVFTASADVKRSGSSAGKLDYVFTNSSGGVCRVFDTRKPSIGQNATSTFGIWVFGDMSNNTLEYWFYSSGTTNQIAEVCTIDWAGWDLKTIPFTGIGGTGDRQFHSTVVRQSSVGQKKGTILFDEGTLFTPTAIEDVREDNFNLSFYPNPLSGEGKVTFNLEERANVALCLYTLDGRKAEETDMGLMEAGERTVTFTPSASLAGGTYILRVEVKSPVTGICTTYSGRWVLTK